MPGAAIADDAVLAAGVDGELGRLCRRYESGADAVARISREVIEAAECLPVLDGRLRMGTEEVVLAAPELGQRVRAAQAVEVANAAAPVDEVEVVGARHSAEVGRLRPCEESRPDRFAED